MKGRRMFDDEQDREETLEDTPELETESGTLESESDGEDKEKLGKRLKDQQAEITRLQQERADRKAEIAELRGMVEGIKSQRVVEEEPSPFAEFDSEGFDETFLDKPGAVLKGTVEKIGYGFVNQRREWQEEIRKLRAELKASSFDDGTRARIAELKKNPRLAALDDDTLAEIAKETPVKRKAKEYPGSPAGGGRTSDRDGPDPAVEKEIKSWMQKLGYTEEGAK